MTDELEIHSPEDMAALIERLDPSDYMTAMMRDRPYDGQSHTDTGERGKQLLEGITMRDIHDAFIRGCFQASGLGPSKWPTSLYDLPWDEMDPLAICQNMLCEIVNGFERALVPPRIGVVRRKGPGDDR